MTALSGDILLFRSSGPTDPPAPAAAEKLNVPLPPRQPEEVTYA